MDEAKESFIPKKAVTQQAAIIYKKAGFGFWLKIAIAVFFLSLAGFGAAYFYKPMIKKENEELSSRLKDVQAGFDTETISEIRAVDKRIHLAETLLKNHRYPSHIFKLLENSVYKGVAFNSLDFTNSEGEIDLALKGEAESYTALVKQRMIFDEFQEIKEARFSNFSLTEDGGVGFSLNLILDPSVLDKEYD
jgi:hypothetical protein